MIYSEEHLMLSLFDLVNTPLATIYSFNANADSLIWVSGIIQSAVKLRDGTHREPARE